MRGSQKGGDKILKTKTSVTSCTSVNKKRRKIHTIFTQIQITPPVGGQDKAQLFIFFAVTKTLCGDYVKTFKSLS